MEFKLFQKLSALHGTDLVLLVTAAALFLLLLYGVVRYQKSGRSPARNRTRALVYGALSMTLSFVLSYFKLFSLLFGGSVTLCSMLPLMLYAAAFGPAWGFGAALAYGFLQFVQGAYVVHPVQLALDYFAAFACLGIPSLFPGKPALGCAAGGTARMLVSTVSGAVFFASEGLGYGFADPWAYSFLYNLLTIGADTLLVVIAAYLPPVRKLGAMMKQ